LGGENRVTEGNKEGQFTSIREQRWTDPDTEGGFQVSRQREQRGTRGARGTKGTRGTRGTRGIRGRSCT
jgi:hypothetical protein